MAIVFGTDAPASSEQTRQLLGWTPNHRTVLKHLEQGEYFDMQARPQA